MKQFFKYTLASMLGTFLTGLILGIIGIIVVSGLIVSTMSGLKNLSELSADQESKMEGAHILKLELDGPIMDRGGNKKLKFSSGNFSMSSETGLNNILDALDKARHDERIKGVRLKIDRVIAGMATVKELRDALTEFRDSSDKFLVAYDQNYSQKSYYLASAADRILLYPQGSMTFNGLASEVTFFKGFLDKFDIDMQVVRGSNNKYKSAVEPFTRKSMSDASRKQMEAYLADLWDVYLKDVSDGRGIPREELNRIADSLLIRSATDAVERGLVDGLRYPDEFDQSMQDSLDLDKDEELPYVSLADYMDVEVPDKHWSRKPKAKKKKEGQKKKEEGKVAVVYAMGAIQSGENGSGVLGAKTTSKAIRKAREDSSIKAVVMRVNSPGGSALASDRIWREVELTLEKKPFIVSMGDLAASGGYYISCAADRIFANPNTITGSIGVFGVIPHTGDMFEKHLGITFDRVKTNEYADLLNSSRPMREREREMIEERIDSIYQKFLRRVANGRGMKVQQVDSIARGRVWSGEDAQSVGLVDEMGGIEAAIAHASEKAGLEDPERVAFPKRESPLKRFLEDLGMNAQKQLFERTVGADPRFYRKYRYLKSVLDMKGIQMRMPYHIEVR